MSGIVCSALPHKVGLLSEIPQSRAPVVDIIPMCCPGHMTGVMALWVTHMPSHTKHSCPLRLLPAWWGRAIAFGGGIRTDVERGSRHAGAAIVRIGTA
jgi:hypothetical protein